MYIPPQFLETDLGRLDWLAAHDSFGTLISMVDGRPFATHLPVLYRREGEKVTLQGHWARPNPHWRTIEGQQSLFIFHGPHAYISPRWYAEPSQNVPTWDYATAHLYGPIHVIHDPHLLEQIVTALADQYEHEAASPWRMADSDGSARLRGIVGFSLSAETIEIKFKLNQNHVKENVTGAIAGLTDRGGEDALAIATLMEAALARRGGP